MSVNQNSYRQTKPLGPYNSETQSKKIQQQTNFNFRAQNCKGKPPISKQTENPIEQNKVYVPIKPFNKPSDGLMNILQAQRQINLKMLFPNDLRIQLDEQDRKLSIADKLSSCEPFEQYEMIKTSPDILERLRIAEQKAQRIPQLEEEIEKKDKFIQFLEQQVNNRAIGCIRCDQRNILISKMRNSLVQANQEILQKVYDLESNKSSFKMTAPCQEDYFQLCQKMDNQMSYSENTIKFMIDKVAKLNQDNKVLGQFSEKLQNQGRQDRQQSIYSTDEISLLRKQDAQMKEKIQQLNEQKLQLWQENVGLKAQLNRQCLNLTFF